MGLEEKGPGITHTPFATNLSHTREKFVAFLFIDSLA